MGKQTKEVNKILIWIEAFDKLQSKAREYFELSINEKDKIKRKRLRKISDKYSEGVENLINKL